MRSSLTAPNDCIPKQPIVGHDQPARLLNDEEVIAAREHLIDTTFTSKFN